MTLAVATDRGQGPAVVLLHGFPELPSSWAAQVEALLAAGARVVVPYLRGYRPSPDPAEPAAYTAEQVCGDIVELLDDRGIQRVLLVGHDWGAQLTWWTAQLHPERVAALVAMSVPFTGRSRRPPIQALQDRFAGSFFYMDYFQAPGVAEAEFAADPADLLHRLYRASSGTPPPGAFPVLPRAGSRFGDQLPAAPAELPDWLPAGELAELVATFTNGGFTGPLNYYRSMDLTWAKLPELAELAVGCPALFLAGERDPVITFTPTARMSAAVADLHGPVLLPGVGHWVQREAPAAVNELLLDFLAEVRNRL